MLINGEEFLTVAEMADRSGKSKNAIKLILHKHNIEPTAKDAIYPVGVYKIIEDTLGPGRPKKEKKGE